VVPALRWGRMGEERRARIHAQSLRTIVTDLLERVRLKVDLKTTDQLLYIAHITHSITVYAHKNMGIQQPAPSHHQPHSSFLAYIHMT